MLVPSNLGQAASILLSLLLVLAPSQHAAASEKAGAPTADATTTAEGSNGFPSNWLSWSPPPECPSQQYIEGRIVEWLGSELPATAELEVNARLTWVDSGRWEVHVVARLNGREGLRHITVEHCSEAADFVALAVVLAVNPDFAPTAAIDSPSPAPPTDAEAISPFASTPAEEPKEPSRPPPVPVSKKTTPLFLSVGARAELDLGTFPSARGGMAVDGAVSWPHWFLSLSGALYPEVQEDLSAVSGPFAFSLLVGRARGCYRFGSSSLRWGPCLSAELGTMQARQTSGHVDPPEATELWSAISAGLQAEVTVLPWLSPFATFDATFPLSRPRFVLDDQTLVHQPSVVALVGALGIRLFFQIR